jgi:hypothetical protein
MLGGFGVSSPTITIYTKVMELFSQETANFVLRGNLSSESFRRTQVG